jgi:CubicO group peptidase (beta-lactamase class C family)
MSKVSVEKTLKQIDEILVPYFNEAALPGLAVGVVHEGSLVCTRNYGFSNIEQRKPVTPDTVFRIGSISKTFTAMAVMQLFAQGKFELDDPVNDHLKCFKVLHRDPNAPPVTIRHLLTHTSGIGELRKLSDIFLPQGGLGANPDMPSLPLGDYYQGVLRSEVYPGEKWAYANHAFNTLGQLVEDVSGQPFAGYMLQHVFEPLGMNKTDYLLSERVRAELAQGYNIKKGRHVPVPYMRIEVPGAGSIFSSVNEMAKYVAALMNGGKNEHGSVLAPELLEMMMTSQYENDARVFNMGLAFILMKFANHRIAWHNGGWPGFISAMYTAPDDGLGVLVFTNSSSPLPDRIAIDLLHRLLGLPDPVSQVPAKNILEAPHLWPELCGFYAPKKGFLTNLRLWVGFGGEVQVIVKENHLALRGLVGVSHKGIPLYRADAGDDLIYKTVLEGNVITVAFQRSNKGGKILRLLVGSNTFYRTQPSQSLRYRLMAVGGVLGGLALFLLGRKMGKMRKT